MSTPSGTPSAPWWSGVTRYQWLVLAIASAGWVFDTFEGQIFNLTRRQMLEDILGADATPAAISRWGDIFLGIFLAGGTLGGILFGWLGDVWGRRPAMIVTILMYSVFSGLTYFATELWQVGVLRFLVAMGVGGEWAVAAALVAEVFPARARAHAGGIFHSTSVLGTWLAALAGLAVDNALVEIDGPEVPIMDGSSAQFVDAIDKVGVTQLSAPRRYVKVLKTVRVEHGRAFSELRPHDGGFRLEVEIDFPQGIIGRQKKVIDLDARTFRKEIARARTFGFMHDVERLWKAGFALGASLENTVAIGDDAVINPEGLRYADEFVRHKLLDAVGDLALAGAPLIANYRSYCGGHAAGALALETPAGRSGDRAARTALSP